MSASVVTCIGCLQCGATCGQCAGRARSEHGITNGATAAAATTAAPAINGVCLKARMPQCSVRLTKEAAPTPRPSGSAPPASSSGSKLSAGVSTVRPAPLPLHSACANVRHASMPNSPRLHAPSTRPPVPLHVRQPNTALMKDGKRIRDACDFGEPSKLSEVAKRKKDDSMLGLAGLSGEGSHQHHRDSRLDGLEDFSRHSSISISSRSMYQGQSQSVSFLNSDPASVLRNVGIPRSKSEHNAELAPKPKPAPKPHLAYRPASAAAERTERHPTPTVFAAQHRPAAPTPAAAPKPAPDKSKEKIQEKEKPPEKEKLPEEKQEEHAQATPNGTDTDPCSDDEDAYSDISDMSDPDNVDDVRAKNPFADGDDSASDFEDNHSVMSGMTVGSACSLTPSLVGETLGGITLTEVPAALHKAGQNVPALHHSLFPHVPPTLKFCQYNEKTDELPLPVRRLLRWRLSTITPQLVRQTITNSGLRLTKSALSSAAETPNWVGTWGKHMKSECFKAVRDFQKVNHFPGTFQIGRKDKLWKNISALQLKFGKNDFGFVPRTYVLPADLKELKMAWRRDGGKRKWIIKPPASARGTGIRVIQRWSQLPKKKQLIVQRYVSRPYLIEDRKFDLRIYVYVTSISPLRVYIHEDGLVRFASVKYSNVGKTLSDRYMHLTNYSINKNSDQYQQNDDAELCQGHKWTLRVFWSYMRERGIDTDALWRRIIDMVVKTVVSGEHHILQLVRQNVVSNYCCHELFGFDVLLDEKLRPWLLEVNISPSLHSAASVDMSVKGPLVRDLLNLSGLHIPNKLSGEQQTEVVQNLPYGDTVQRLVLDKRLYTSVCTPEERAKQNEFARMERAQYITKILENLTPDDVRHLIRAEDELTRRGGFIRIFPTVSTHHYHQYFEKARYYNRLLDAWEVRFSRDREAGRARLRLLCQDKYHLIVPSNYLRRRTFNAETVAAAEAVRRAQLLAQAKVTVPAAGRAAKTTPLANSRTVSSDSGISSMESESQQESANTTATTSSTPAASAAAAAGPARPRPVRAPTVSTRPAYKSLPALRRARQCRPLAAARAGVSAAPAAAAAAPAPASPADGADAGGAGGATCGVSAAAARPASAPAHVAGAADVEMQPVVVLRPIVPATVHLVNELKSSADDSSPAARQAGLHVQGHQIIPVSRPQPPDP